VNGKEMCRAAYRRGVKEALNQFGIYKDGVQRIGAMEHPILEIMKDVDKGEWDDAFEIYWRAEQKEQG